MLLLNYKHITISIYCVHVFQVVYQIPARMALHVLTETKAHIAVFVNTDILEMFVPYLQVCTYCIRILNMINNAFLLIG